MDCKKLSDAPHAGRGLHDWILKTSRQLVISGWSKEGALRVMLAKAEGKGRKVDREISDAIDGALAWLQKHPDATFLNASVQYNRNTLCYDYMGTGRIDRRDNRPGHLPVDQTKVARILRGRSFGFGRGADRFDWWVLLGGYNYNLCFCLDVERPKVCKFGEWLESNLLARLQFMIPSPMLECGRGGAFKCDRNTAKRLYLVVEFDRGTLEEQFKLLKWLERIGEWELAIAVYSGGKSLHGWFPCYRFSEREIKTFFREATTIGADRQMLIPSQYCRVPNGWNYKYKRRQKVVYWNEEVIEEQNQLIDTEE